MYQSTIKQKENHKGTLKKKDFFLVIDLSVRDFGRDAEILEKVVEEFKGGSLVRISLPAREHEPIEGVRKRRVDRLWHAVALLNVLYHFAVVHTRVRNLSTEMKHL